MKRILSACVLLAVALGSAFSVAQQTKAAALRPPKGADVALVVFEDLQCPDCARAAPLVEEAARAYKIPVVRHDFPLPQHKWAFDGAVLARWFDTKSKRTGDEFRMFLFKNQPAVTPENLRSYGERFAAQNKLELPFAIDPTGALAAKVTADRNLGIRIGIEHTPTLYVVSSSTAGQPFVEVVDRSHLFELIEKMKRQTTASKK